jgi:hypothetical protein
MSKERWSVTAARIRRATRLMTAAWWRDGMSTADVLAKVKATVEEAFVGDRTWIRGARDACPTAVAAGSLDPEETMLTSAGIYRMIFLNDGIDRADQRVQETIFALVQRTAHEGLDMPRDAFIRQVEDEMRGRLRVTDM